MLQIRFCAWTFLLCLAALLGGFIFGHPPLPPVPSVPWQDVVAAYEGNGNRILIFAVLTCVSSALFFPAICALSVAMLRMQPRSMLAAILQVVGGVFALIGPFLAGMLMTGAVLRPDTPAQMIVTLNDLTVIFLELSTVPALLQGICIAYAAFSDRSTDPILPKWYAWISLIWSIVAQGGVLAVFFATGPLAPDGLVGIILPTISLFVWMIATVVVLFRIKPSQWLEQH